MRFVYDRRAHTVNSLGGSRNSATRRRDNSRAKPRWRICEFAPDANSGGKRGFMNDKQTRDAKSRRNRDCVSVVTPGGDTVLYLRKPGRLAKIRPPTIGNEIHSRATVLSIRANPRLPGLSDPAVFRSSFSLFSFVFFSLSTLGVFFFFFDGKILRVVE